MGVLREGECCGGVLLDCSYLLLGMLRYAAGKFISGLQILGARRGRTAPPPKRPRLGSAALRHFV
jgi:hypothetical protein